MGPCNVCGGGVPCLWRSLSPSTLPLLLSLCLPAVKPKSYQGPAAQHASIVVLVCCLYYKWHAALLESRGVLSCTRM